MRCLLGMPGAHPMGTSSIAVSGAHPIRGPHPRLVGPEPRTMAGGGFFSSQSRLFIALGHGLKPQEVHRGWEHNSQCRRTGCVGVKTKSTFSVVLTASIQFCDEKQPEVIGSSLGGCSGGDIAEGRLVSHECRDFVCLERTHSDAVVAMLEGNVDTTGSCGLHQGDIRQR